MLEHADTDADIARCYPVMAQLRTHVRQDEFVAIVRHQQSEGYRLAYLECDGAVVAAAGYRISTNLFMGKNLYVDDLVTAERARSRGHGRAMLDALREIARQQGCAYLHLDSGTQRRQAHRFYFREGLVVSSFHFSEEL